MAFAVELPVPHLNARLFGARCLSALTDDALFDATGVRIAFTGRAGGVSEEAFASLNLGGQVGDSERAVAQNRRILLEALGAGDSPLIMAKQVHGSEVVQVTSSSTLALEQARQQALAGSDGLMVSVPQLAALLCFADCAPVVLVSPWGAFAVVHAGWRGAVAGIAGKAAHLLASHEASLRNISAPKVAGMLNAYIGPHIRSECFETGLEVRQQFIDRFGESVSPSETQVSLSKAISCDLEAAGLVSQRIVDAGICTKCSNGDYFSYRASGGICGRHGAFAYRQKG